MKKIKFLTILISGLMLSNCSTDGNSEQTDSTINNNQKIIYSFRTEFNNPNYERKIISINKYNGVETLISNLGIGNPKCSELSYLTSSKELVTLMENNSLIVINSLTGNNYTTLLNQNVNISYKESTVDNTENIFLFKTENLPPNYNRKIVKVNKSNGSEVLISDLGIGVPKSNAIEYLNSTNEIVSLMENNSLIFVNTQNGNYSNIQLNQGSNVLYREAVIDDSENIYLFKNEYQAPNYTRKIVKINKSTGSEILISSLGIGSPKCSGMIFDKENNEILCIMEENIINIVKIDNGNYTELQLNNNSIIRYRDLCIAK